MKLKHIFFTLAAMAFFSAAQAQVKIGANPGTIEQTSALEVEATNGNKTTINKTDGRLMIKDGSQGTGKVLTSDANGIASWQNSPTQNTDVLLSVQLTTPQLVPGNYTVLAYNVKDFDKGNNFALPSTFTAPSDGYYFITFTVSSGSQPAARTGRNIGITVSGSQNYNRILIINGVEANDGYSANATQILYLKAGDRVVTTAAAVNFQYTVVNAYLQISKISN